jgi:hypothetical protein
MLVVVVVESVVALQEQVELVAVEKAAMQQLLLRELQTLVAVVVAVEKPLNTMVKQAVQELLF